MYITVFHLNFGADYSHFAVLTPHRFLFCLEISAFKSRGTRDAAEDASPWKHPAAFRYRFKCSK